MHPLYDYDLCIFDCDGVILDSNELKITAMEQSVIDAGFDTKKATECKEYFSNNFGRSRFFHIQHFVDEILPVDKKQKQATYDNILEIFSKKCSAQYVNTDTTPNFERMLSLHQAKKAVASGSEQEELRALFKSRGFSDNYEYIFGSPTHKSENVATILKEVPHTKAVMIGDAVADFEAASINSIDFIAYLPFSNVRDVMLKLAKKHDFCVIDEWPINEVN
jgi:phosphoglycolate phosphatase-like HAD superfamily hydrolase